MLVKDERDGAFMADAYARVARIPGVCDGTLGPGATNLVTGLAESFGAGVPVIALAGESNSMIAGKHATQESDQLAILRPTVKEAIRVERIERVPELVRRAYTVATGGRPGPVLLNVREDVTHGRHAFAAADLSADPATCRLPGRRSRPDPVDVEAAAALLARARRPVILAGGGIHLSDAYAAVGGARRPAAASGRDHNQRQGVDPGGRSARARRVRPLQPDRQRRDRRGRRAARRRLQAGRDRDQPLEPAARRRRRDPARRRPGGARAQCPARGRTGRRRGARAGRPRRGGGRRGRGRRRARRRAASACRRPGARGTPSARRNAVRPRARSTRRGC